MNSLDHSLLVLARVASNALFAIAFLQSGLDKVFDRKGNVEYFRNLFAKSVLRHGLSFTLVLLTGFELITGSVNAAGAITGLMSDPMLGTAGALLATLNVLALFFGLRLAKDYAGAAGVVPYFVAALASVFLYAI